MITNINIELNIQTVAEGGELNRQELVVEKCGELARRFVESRTNSPGTHYLALALLEEIKREVLKA